MQQKHLSTGNHNIEFVYGMNEDLEYLDSQPNSYESDELFSMEVIWSDMKTHKFSNIFIDNQELKVITAKISKF